MATKWTQESILIKLKELHPDLIFSDFVYKTVNDKSLIICQTHGIREMKVMNLLRGNSCKLCKPQSQKRTPETIIDQFNEKHSSKYTYPNFMNYQNQNQIIDIVCPIHGRFEQQIIHHSNGSGCKKCHDRTFNRKDLESHILSINDNQKLLYDYIDIHYNFRETSQTFIEINCKKCKKIFIQNLSNHKNNSGCPNCAKSEAESKGIKLIKSYLEELEVIFLTEITFKDCINPITGYKLRFDIFIESLNCCIEFDGQQHFIEIDYFGGREELEKNKYRDKLKNEYCLKNGIHLIRINYKEDIKNVLKNRLGELCH